MSAAAQQESSLLKALVDLRAAAELAIQCRKDNMTPALCPQCQIIMSAAIQTANIVLAVK